MTRDSCLCFEPKITNTLKAKYAQNIAFVKVIAYHHSLSFQLSFLTNNDGGVLPSNYGGEAEEALLSTLSTALSRNRCHLTKMTILQLLASHSYRERPDLASTLERDILSYERSRKNGALASSLTDALPFQSQYARLAGEFLTDLAVANPNADERANRIASLMEEDGVKRSFLLGCMDSLLKIKAMSKWNDAQREMVYSPVMAHLKTFRKNEENLCLALKVAFKFCPSHGTRPLRHSSEFRDSDRT